MCLQPGKGSMARNEAGDMGGRAPQPEQGHRPYLSATEADDSFAARERPDETGVWESKYVGMGQLGQRSPEERCTEMTSSTSEVQMKTSKEVQGIRKAFPGGCHGSQASQGGRWWAVAGMDIVSWAEGPD